MREMLNYCNYHRHSRYTNVRISDSVTSNEEYAKRAVETGGGILSSCEHGWQGNYREVYKLAKQYNLKPLISTEAYWVKDRFEKDKTNAHIFIAAMNEAGRQELNDVLSEANLTGFYGQPRLDIDLILSLTPENVIVTTACVAGWKYEDVEEIFEKFSKHFKDHFYLEVQYHNTPSQIALNERILALREKLGCKIIMGCDSHYIQESDAYIRDDFLRSKEMNYPDEDGWYMDYPDGDTAYKRFATQCVLSHDEIIEAIINTNIFLNVEEYDNPIFNDELKLPTLYPDLTQEKKNNIYKELVWNGWEDYKQTIPEDRWPEYIEEINKEIQTVIDTNMADYFIIDHAIVKRAKEKGGILTKSGRGSAPSFFTNTLLGFSDIDRISAPVHMYPERFMSTTRILESHAIPDIDLNEANPDVFMEAQAEILGQEHSYPMVAFGTMKTAAAWKLYAKAKDIPFEIANEISAQLQKYEKTIKDLDEEEREEVDIRDFIPADYYGLYEESTIYQKTVVSWSIAPCSSLIYEGDIRKDIGLAKVKDSICCVMDGHWAEEGHFLKNDHLKVLVVEIINKTFKRIGMETPSVKELINMCPPEDPVWDIYKNACTWGINQCERDSTKHRVKTYGPKNISELCAFVAAIRPGGSLYYKQFESRKPFSYGLKSFDGIIQTKEFPYSFLIYQEQIMRALNYAGIDMADCYTAIKHIAKKRVEKVFAYKDKFVSGFQTALIREENKSEEEASEIALNLWKAIEAAANYGYNASHSYCVAIDSLYGAWLKAHHPIEFYETYINILIDNGAKKDKISQVKKEAEEYFDIEFEPLAFGQDNRTIHAEGENTIINSITTIKGYGKTVGEVLYECSKENLEFFVDVLEYLDKYSIKEAKYLPLIHIDYFSTFGNQRELEEISKMWNALNQGKSKTVRRDIFNTPELKGMIERYTCGTTKSGSEAARYTFISPDSLYAFLKAYEKYVKSLGFEDYTMKEKCRQSFELVDSCNIRTKRPEDRRRLLVTDVFELVGKNKQTWAHRISTRSLGSGKEARLTVKEDMYQKNPIEYSDIIYAEDLYKNPKGYWYLSKYRIEEKQCLKK